MSTQEKLDRARERYESAKSQFEAAGGRVGMPTDDPGALSGIRRRNTTRQTRREAANVDRTVDLAKEVMAAGGAVKSLEHKLRAERRDAQIRANATCDLENLAPGDLVRYEKYGRVGRNVGRVQRVNKKTVTLETPEPFDPVKVPLDKIVATIKQEEPS